MNKDNNNIFELAYDCLMQQEPETKVVLVNVLAERLAKKELDFDSNMSVKQIEIPGRPDKPELVKASEVPRRGFDSSIARVRLTHAIAHIEFNAINLAIDAVYRFQDMPAQYYVDWMKIAFEEAKHYTLLNQYLIDNGSFYGEYAAHNGLWEMAVKTDHDVFVRMALVPRVLEARGLDVTPGMIERLINAKDEGLVSILKIIHQDEIGHVHIGTTWFNYLSEKRGLKAETAFSDILDEYMPGASFGPFDMPSREQAGFTKQEMQDLMRRANS